MYSELLKGFLEGPGVPCMLQDAMDKVTEGDLRPLEIQIMSLCSLVKFVYTERK